MNMRAALDRLIANKPLRTAEGYKINNDTVAIEAELKRGAIKRSRPELAEFLEEIKEAEANRLGKEHSKIDSKIVLQNDFKKLKTKLNELQSKYDTQLLQINSLLYENHTLKNELKQYEEREMGDIIPFPPNK